MALLIEQQSIVDETKKSLLVPASAGSGKTTVLIQKIASELSTKTAFLKNIVVLTFTKAAASEMKKRLFEKISSMEQTDETRAIIDELPNSNISTIHSFCQKLIEKNFHILGVDPILDILSTAEKNHLKENAFAKAVKNFENTKSMEVVENTEALSKGRNMNLLKEIVFNMADKLESVEDKKEWKEKNFFKIFEKDEEILSCFRQELTNIIENLLKKMQNMEEKAEMRSFNKAKQYLQQHKIMLREILKRSDFFSLADGIASFVLEPKTKAKEKDLIFDEEFSAALQSWREILKKAQSFSAYGDADLQKRIKETNMKVMKAIFELFELFEKEFKIEKVSFGKVDFSDLEELTFKLLENEEVCNNIAKEFSLIFVDEYQDTNRVQEAILKKIAKFSRVMMVGDIKQSIYGFREADPSIFMERWKNFDERNDARVQMLSANFRSHPKVLKFVDEFFSQCMTESSSQHDYSNLSRFKALAKFEDSKFPSVQVSCVVAPKKEKKEITGVFNVVENFENGEEESLLEARLIAEKILSLRGKEIFDAKLQKMKTCDFGDFAILARKNTDCEIIQKHLAEMGIPCMCAGMNVLSNMKEIKWIISVLKCVSNIQNDVPLVGAMLSPFGGFDDFELACIKNASDEKHLFFWQKVFNEANNDEKVAKFVQKMTELKEFLSVEGISSTINEIAKTFPKDEISPLFEKIVEAFKTTLVQNEHDLEGMLEKIDANNGVVSAKIIFESAFGFVGISTIHASKGLEYPIVFLPFSGNKLTVKSKGMKYSRNLGFIENFSSEGKSIQKDFLCLKLFKQDFAEDMRVKYVAQTRAKNMLIITAVLKNLPTKKDDVFDCSLLEATLMRLSNDDFEKFITNKTFEIKSNEEWTTFSIENALTKSSHEQEEILPPSKELESCTREYFSFNHKEKVGEKIETSVTEIVENSKKTSSENLANEKNTFSNNDEIDSIQSNEGFEKELGSAYHMVMEKINFEKINETFEKAIEQTENKFGEVFKKINKEKIELAAKNIIELAPKNSTFLKEQPFQMMNENSSKTEFSIIKGVIDLLVVGENKIQIYDYKLTKKTNEETIKNAFSTQLCEYEKAVRKATKINDVEKFVVLLNTGKIVKI